MKRVRRAAGARRALRLPFLMLAALLVLAACVVVAPRPVHAEGQGVVASVIAIDGKLTLDRPGKGKYAAFVQMPDYVNDRLTTDANSLAALEFTVGGKIGINKGSSIEITGARSATDASGHVLKVNSGAIWAKFNKQKAPLLIRTPSTTIGIRGTEFLVSAGTDSTTIDVFEGQVAYAPVQETPGEATAELPANAAVAGPGTRVVIDNALKAKVENYDPEKLRKEDAELYRDLASAMVALRIVSNIAGFVPGASPVSTYVGYAAWGVEAVTNPEQAARDLAASQVESHVPGGGILGGVIRSGGGNKPKDPNFPIELKPYDQENVNPSDLKFSWKPFKDAKQYVVLLGTNENMDQGNLTWAATVKEPGLVYPADGPPLQAGQKYYWRVVAMNDEGKPKGKASQSWFVVSSDYKPPAR